MFTLKRPTAFYPEFDTDRDAPTGTPFTMPAGTAVAVLRQHELTSRPLIVLPAAAGRIGFVWSNYYDLA